jgi:hypothetical protein
METEMKRVEIRRELLSTALRQPDILASILGLKN